MIITGISLQHFLRIITILWLSTQQTIIKMFKIVFLFAVIAICSVSAEPKPGVFAYSAPLVAAPVVAEGGAVYERTYHGNLAPFSPYAAYVSSPYVAAPLAYSAPYVAAAPAPLLVK
ncbi:uncharacterized protein LOC129770982 [Toxorhynchites rutilus septentrionalis]|uniref:uncharacterized protein LOC129770982 n=1 Tax=Toxorhynchites rutilus septentrionalis TaxID=329112 RepID=UPI00247AD209|nr:uncharacterized protein LOC129770982 [Toxorhynchites rutilus septentrionalis]